MLASCNGPKFASVVIGATATYGRLWPSHPPPSAPSMHSVSYTGVHRDIVDQPISDSSLPDTFQG